MEETMKSLDALEADLLNQNKFTKKIKIIIVIFEKNDNINFNF